METLLAVAEGKAPGYQITDLAKLERLAAEFGVAADLPPQAKARELALAMMEEYGIKKGLSHFHQAPAGGPPGEVEEAGHHAPGHRPGSRRRCCTAPTWGWTTTR